MHIVRYVRSVRSAHAFVIANSSTKLVLLLLLLLVACCSLCSERVAAVRQGIESPCRGLRDDYAGAMTLQKFLLMVIKVALHRMTLQTR